MAGVLAVALVLAASACSDDGGSSDAATTTAAPSTDGEATTTAAEAAPAGPAADVSEELTGGDGPFLAAGAPDDLEALGYQEQEYVAAGTATSYAAEGELGGDGRWSFVDDGEADYRTRILVRTPEDPAAFSGTVVFEWLNVSSGADAEPEWTNLQEELARAGDAWVGVSAQQIGVEGGPVAVSVDDIPGADFAGKGLKAIDPERYGDLAHPGDGFSFDIFTQVARAIGAGEALDGLEPERLVAAGQSQSAFALVTYYDGVQPLTETFDGFYVHSRGGTPLPLVGPGEAADIAAALGGEATVFRDDIDAPVMDLQTEGDVTSLIGSYAARQDDSDTFRLWEVAGTAHADLHTIGEAAEFIDCGVAINDGPLHVVAKAAYRALADWMDSGEPPPEAPRLEVTEGDAPEITRDDDGIAVGGIRTPPVDVPVAALTGEPGPDPSTICLLLGSTIPFTEVQLEGLYPSPEGYEQQYDEATDATIEAGWALEDDRDALEAYADPSGIPG